MIVDGHCHASLAWFEPVESLVQQMDRNEVDRAVLVQIRGQTNNAYLFDCARRYPGRFAVVVGLDETSPDALETLERLVGEGANGVRLLAAARSPGSDPLAIWRKAASLGIAVSCLGMTEDLVGDGFADLVQTVPDVTIAIEHLGAGMGTGPVDLDTWPAVLRLARFPNVFIKIPGLGELAQRRMPVDEKFPFVRPVPPLLERVHAAFGASRMMWGSDFPPVSAREGYANALRLTREHLASASPEDRDLIFGGVAGRLFPVRP